MKFLYTISIFCTFLFTNLSVQGTEVAAHQFQKEQPISNQQCISCHQQSQHDWQQSVMPTPWHF
ncbi:MAG: hypothetical protein HRT54_20020 [Colwellia sp.]|nr:hypothetical protein [Colwellia sp.]